MENRQSLAPVLLALILCAFTSCTVVKEDRTACPCTLYVHLNQVPAAGVSIDVSEAGTQDHLTTLYLTGGEGAPADTTLTVTVPKTGVRVMAVSGAQLEPDGRVLIPLGYDAPPLYLFAAQVPTPGDTAHVAVQLHKHYCLLTLSMEEPPGWGEPYWTEVRGRVSGIEKSGTPLEGDFRCRLDPGGSIRLPRQHPASELWLDIVMPRNVVRSFALGTYMLEARYDWTAQDLEDLQLEIVLSVTHINLSTGNWNKTIPFPVEI